MLVHCWAPSTHLGPALRQAWNQPLGLMLKALLTLSPTAMDDVSTTFSIQPKEPKSLM